MEEAKNATNASELVTDLRYSCRTIPQVAKLVISRGAAQITLVEAEEEAPAAVEVDMAEHGELRLGEPATAVFHWPSTNPV